MKTTNRLVPGYPIPVSERLYRTLVQYIEQQGQQRASSVTLNFRDQSYSADEGGYHPVEINVQRKGNEWHILYISDFAYMGNYYPELERNMDFDFGNGQDFVAYMGWQPIRSRGVRDLYRLWERNFLSYLKIGTYDSISVND
ncbi:hypothetical protein CGJ66_22555 [Vibrio parahaemolyticus]|uniref:DUF2787 domain-containing protein n=1 Tax=Vibrio parahaemolyticus TaxID=670 RepID=UPI00111E5C9D|nr:DUF2787 domain-containing protein [Vibrio parahaemolyticus]TOD30835.1 hypothetical protein CGJ66_22555 [Vibrio parahaemolyticus]